MPPSKFSDQSHKATLINEEVQNDCTEQIDLTVDDDEPPEKKLKRGQYRSYSLQFKMSVVTELMNTGTPIGVLACKYNVPRTTIMSWRDSIMQKEQREPRWCSGDSHSLWCWPCSIISQGSFLSDETCISLLEES